MGKTIVSLRKITESDIPFIVKWRNSAFVSNNFVIRNAFTEENQKEWINNVVAKGKAIQYIILHDNSPIGSVYIRDIDYIHRKGEFGIFIGERDFAGKGAGLIATRDILQIAFDELKLHRVYLRVFTDNISAIKTYEKAGFIKEGLLRDTVYVDGKFRDMFLMGIVNNEN